MVYLFPTKIVQAESVDELIKNKPTGYVSDFAGILKASEKADLENLIATNNAGSNGTSTYADEIAVVTIKTLDGNAIEPFANELFRGWGIGQKGKDNGILVLVALAERQMRIEVGYGLEGSLTDLQSFKIIDGILKPAFREGKYGQGLYDGVSIIISTVNGDTSRIDQLESAGQTGLKSGFLGMIFSSADSFFTFLFFLFGFIFPILGSILGRSKSWWFGGILGSVVGIVAGLVFSAGLFILVYVIGYALIGLIFDYIVSKNYRSGGSDRGGFGGWFYGGGGFGSGGGSSSFGGFSGGSSGGGGSSGSW